MQDSKERPPSDVDQIHALAATLRALVLPAVLTDEAQAALDVAEFKLGTIAEELEAFGANTQQRGAA